VLRTIGTGAPALLADLAATFPPPRRNMLLRAEGRIGRWLRGNDLIRRCERTTRRPVTARGAVASLIHG
jgi:hypothetical protein